MYTFECVQLNAGNFSQWDTLIDHSSEGTVFHKSGWLDTCARSLGKKVRIFGCFMDDQLIGGCSLFITRKWGVVSIANSTCTMTPYGGFVLSTLPVQACINRNLFRQVVGSLINEIKKANFYSIDISNSPDFFDIRPFTLSGWKSYTQYTYYINLNNDLESHADHLVKKNIRKAERNQIRIEPFSDISRYYDLLSETFRRKNLNPPCSKNFITDLYAFIRDQNCGEMMVAKTPEDEIACAEIVLWDHQQAYVWSAVSDARFKESGSPSLLRFDDLKRMQARGIPKINMMTGNVLELSQFTAHMNPTLVPYYQIQNRFTSHIRSSLFS